MANCKHDCSTCSSACGTRNKDSFIKPINKHASVKRVVAVASGKGGVGKSLVTALLAVRARARGYRTGILDADITGPSIPKAFGLTELARGTDGAILPVETESGIRIISMNSLLEHEDDPVVWRGSLIAGAATQFWTDVEWGDLDMMFIDMPPGTGDVPLTVFQSIPLSGLVVVTTPQDLVEMIVGKAVNMAKMMNIPLLGIAENMSYFVCPDCGKAHEIFGKSRVEEMKEKFDFPAYARIPLSFGMRELADGGNIERADTDPLAEIFAVIEKSGTIGKWADLPRTRWG